MGKLFAIGDIHGCYNELMGLMDTLVMHADLHPETDTVVFLGDYIDRGSQSMQVVKQLMEWERKYPHWKFLYGNHEDMMMLAWHRPENGTWDWWWQQGGKQTALSYYPKNLTQYEYGISQPKDHVSKDHIKWLKERPLYHEQEGYFFVHAGVLPDTPLEEIKTLADNGNQDIIENLLWIRDEFHNSKFDWGKTIVFGHNAFPPNYMPFIGKDINGVVNKIGIDCAVCPPAKQRLCAVQLSLLVESSAAPRFYFQEAIQ